jgi:phospholipid-binding lipoprotein MlaA
MKKFFLSLNFLFLISCSSTTDTINNQKFKGEDEDTLKPFNKTMYHVVMTLERYALRPIGKTYKFVVPELVRDRITNFFDNLSQPFRMMNNLAQGDGATFAENLGAFVLNTTTGLGGLFNVAGSMGAYKYNNDLGTTMAYYDVEQGPYLFVYRPSNVRDFSGEMGELVLDPKNLFFATMESGVIFSAVNGFNSYVNMIPMIEQAESISVDGYTGMKSMWTQYRRKQVNDSLKRAGKSEMETKQDNFSMDIDEE